MHKLLQFKNTKLLNQALTHRSYVNESNDNIEDNERLEFLGDAILNFLSGSYLYNHSNNMSEEEMTRRRAALVDEKQLAKFAEIIDLRYYMLLGEGAKRDGGYSNPNLLSSTFEAVIGAYYLDNNCNIEAVRPLVEELFEAVPKDLMIVRSNVDSKNRFQQWIQANKISPNPPRYLTEKVEGTPDHSPQFISKVYVDQQLYGKGTGKNKKEAEKAAAENALIRDSKNRFQQWVQTEMPSYSPEYKTEKVAHTPGHSPQFMAKVYVNQKLCGEGKGNNKKEAEKMAAENALIHFIK